MTRAGGEGTRRPTSDRPCDDPFEVGRASEPSRAAAAVKKRKNGHKKAQETQRRDFTEDNEGNKGKCRVPAEHREEDEAPVAWFRKICSSR